MTTPEPDELDTPTDATPTEPAAGSPVQWVDIHAGGSETRRRGVIWSAAPSTGGRGRGWWVLPVDGTVLGSPETAPGRWSALYVVETSTRHRCGRQAGHGYAPRGGRWVDAGTWYRETHRQAPTAAPPPARTPRPDETAMDNFRALIERQGAQEAPPRRPVRARGRQLPPGARAHQVVFDEPRAQTEGSARDGA